MKKILVKGVELVFDTVAEVAEFLNTYQPVEPFRRIVYVDAATGARLPRKTSRKKGGGHSRRPTGKNHPLYGKKKGKEMFTEGSRCLQMLHFLTKQGATTEDRAIYSHILQKELGVNTPKGLAGVTGKVSFIAKGMGWNDPVICSKRVMHYGKLRAAYWLGPNASVFLVRAMRASGLKVNEEKAEAAANRGT